MWGQLSKITQYTRDALAESLANEEDDDESDSSQIEENGSEYSHSVGQTRDLENLVQTLKSDCDNWKKQYNEAERKNRTVVSEFNRLLQEKEGELVAVQKQIAEEKMKHEKAQQEAQKTNQKLQQQVKSLQNKFIDSVNELPPQLPSSPEHSKSEAGTSTAENSASDTEHYKEEELDKLRRQSLQLQRKNEEIISTLKTQISDDEETIASLKVQLEEEKQKNETLQNEIESTKRLQRKHEEVVASLMHQIRDNEEVILSLQAEVEAERHRADEIHSQKQIVGPSYETLKTELENLQGYMEQVESNHRNDIEVRTFQLRQQISQLTQELTEAQTTVKSLTEFREENVSLKVRLQDQDQKMALQSAELQRLQEDYHPLHVAFQRTLNKLNEQLENGENLIDKRIVTKLFITYHTDVAQRAAILNVMSGILNFTEDEQRAVGLITDTSIVARGRLGWIRDWWNKSSVPTASTFLKQSEKHVKSLSELWIEFLLHEAQQLEEGAVENPIESNEPKPQAPTFTVVPALTPQSTPTKPTRTLSPETDNKS